MFSGQGEGRGRIGVGGGNRPRRPVGVGRCAANPKADWTKRARVDLPLETEEIQKGTGRRFSASRNPLGPPSPRPTAGQAGVSERAGRRRWREPPAVGAQDLSCRASLARLPFMGVISAPV